MKFAHETVLTQDAAIESLTEALTLNGFDTTNNESTRDTPKRFLSYIQEFNQPLEVAAILKEGFDAGTYGGVVAQAGIPFVAICEHHLLPMFGHACIGYLPNKRVLGLSKLARIVNAVGHERPSLQEAITDRIASLLNGHLEPKGVVVVIEAQHTCMSSRGVNTPGVITTTSSVKGLFRDVASARDEFFRLIEPQRLSRMR